jgi:hypothetical protein
MFNFHRHDVIETIIKGFGSLFDNIYYSRLDASGNEVARYRVPLSYGPKQKFLVRLNQSNPDLTHNVEISLPRMSFEMTTMSYSSLRKMTHTAKTAQYSDEAGYLKYRLSKAPWDMVFNLNIMTKNTSDAFCILEQILPIFGPSYTLTFKGFPVDDKADVPVSINSVNIVEEYEGDFVERKVVIATIQFTVNANLYGYVPEAKVITRTTANLIDFDTLYVTGVTGNETTGFQVNVYGITGATMSSIYVNVTGGATAGTFGPTGTYEIIKTDYEY